MGRGATAAQLLTCSSSCAGRPTSKGEGFCAASHSTASRSSATAPCSRPWPSWYCMTWHPAALASASSCPAAACSALASCSCCAAGSGRKAGGGSAAAASGKAARTSCVATASGCECWRSASSTSACGTSEERGLAGGGEAAGGAAHSGESLAASRRCGVPSKLHSPAGGQFAHRRPSWREEETPGMVIGSGRAARPAIQGLASTATCSASGKARVCLL